MGTNTNFARLWERLRTVSEMYGDDKLKATLLNHESHKEYICRKLGVVTELDVNRVSGGLEEKFKRKSK